MRVDRLELCNHRSGPVTPIRQHAIHRRTLGQGKAAPHHMRPHAMHSRPCRRSNGQHATHPPPSTTSQGLLSDRQAPLGLGIYMGQDHPTCRTPPPPFFAALPAGPHRLVGAFQSDDWSRLHGAYDLGMHTAQVDEQAPPTMPLTNSAT